MYYRITNVKHKSDKSEGDKEEIALHRLKTTLA